MSRSGYDYDCDGWDRIRWRGQVASATRGKRGQQLLRDLLAALDAMPDKRLIADELVAENGAVCALGCLGRQRGIDMSSIDPEDCEVVADAFGIATPLAREIQFMNDEGLALWSAGEQERDVPALRWRAMRAWVAEQIKPDDSRALAEGGK